LPTSVATVKGELFSEGKSANYANLREWEKRTAFGEVIAVLQRLLYFLY
jgi:hypothetical protein